MGSLSRPPLAQTLRKRLVENIEHQKVAPFSRGKGFGKTFRRHATKLDNVFVIETREHFGFGGQFGSGNVKIIGGSDLALIDRLVSKHFRGTRIVFVVIVVGVEGDHIDLAVGSRTNVPDFFEFLAINGTNGGRIRC